MDLAVSVGMWNRDFEGPEQLPDIIIQLAGWIDTVSWMITTLQTETGKSDYLVLTIVTVFCKEL